jgi:hypothetical protein
MAISMAGGEVVVTEMAMADKVAGVLVLVTEVATGELEVKVTAMATATAGREEAFLREVPRADLATTRRMEVIPRTKVGAMTKAPVTTATLRDLMDLERVVTLGAATLEREVILEATRDPLAMVGVLQTTVTRVLLEATGDPETMATQALLTTVGLLATTATRALETLTRETRAMTVEVAKMTLVTIRAVDGKVGMRKRLGSWRLDD